MKKQTLKLLIIILAAVLVLSGGAAAVIFTVVLSPLPAPELSEEVYPSGEPAYSVTFMWESVKNAFGYRVEYKYDLYPDELYKTSVKANSATVDRKKGVLSWRVMTLGQRKRQDSDFSDWKTFDVPPIPLDAPAQVSYAAFSGESGVYYQIIPETWRSGSYTYLYQIKTIEFYEVAVAAPDVSKELALRDTRFVSAQEFLDEEHSFPPASGNWTIYYRAINTKGYYGEFGGLPDEPIELFEIFAPSPWVEVTVTAT
ncbi:MAG: hypothetical protein WC292_06985 [Clostridia bacterium]